MTTCPMCGRKIPVEGCAEHIATCGLDSETAQQVKDWADRAGVTDEHAAEDGHMRQSLSSGHYSTDCQLEDAVGYLADREPVMFAAFLAAFPEWETRTMGELSSWFDTDAMGVDQEWSSWAVDWVEDNTAIYWEDGEPWIGGYGEDDDDDDDAGRVTYDPSCVRCRYARPGDPTTHADHEAGRANLASATILLGVAATGLAMVAPVIARAVEMLGGAA